MPYSKYEHLRGTEEVSRQVAAGVPFRDAYTAVAKTIDDGTFAPDRTLRHVHDGSWGNLRNDGVAGKLKAVLEEGFGEVVLDFG